MPQNATHATVNVFTVHIKVQVQILQIPNLRRIRRRGANRLFFLYVCTGTYDELRIICLKKMSNKWIPVYFDILPG